MYPHSYTNDKKKEVEDFIRENLAYEPSQPLSERSLQAKKRIDAILRECSPLTQEEWEVENAELEEKRRCRERKKADNKRFAETLQRISRLVDIVSCGVPAEFQLLSTARTLLEITPDKNGSFVRDGHQRIRDYCSTLLEPVQEQLFDATKHADSNIGRMAEGIVEEFIPRGAVVDAVLSGKLTPTLGVRIAATKVRPGWYIEPKRYSLLEPLLPFAFDALSTTEYEAGLRILKSVGPPQFAIVQRLFEIAITELRSRDPVDPFWASKITAILRTLVFLLVRIRNYAHCDSEPFLHTLEFGVSMLLSKDELEKQCTYLCAQNAFPGYFDALGRARDILDENTAPQYLANLVRTTIDGFKRGFRFGSPIDSGQLCHTRFQWSPPNEPFGNFGNKWFDDNVPLLNAGGDEQPVLPINDLAAQLLTDFGQRAHDHRVKCIAWFGLTMSGKEAIVSFDQLRGLFNSPLAAEARWTYSKLGKVHQAHDLAVLKAIIYSSSRDLAEAVDRSLVFRNRLRRHVFLQDDETFEDCFRDFVLKLLVEPIDNFVPREHTYADLTAKLVTSFRHLVISRYRRQNTANKYAAQLAQESSKTAISSSPLDNVIAKDQLEYLLRAIDGLPLVMSKRLTESQYTVFRLCILDGLSVAEAAKMIGQSVQNVRRHLRNVRGRIRTYFRSIDIFD